MIKKTLQIGFLGALWFASVAFANLLMVDLTIMSDLREIRHMNEYEPGSNRMMTACRDAFIKDRFIVGKPKHRDRTYYKAKASCEYHLFTLEDRRDEK